MSGLFGGALNALQGKLQDRGFLSSNRDGGGHKTFSQNFSPLNRVRGRSSDTSADPPLEQYTQTDFLKLLGEVRDGLQAAASGRLVDEAEGRSETNSLVQRLVEAVRETTEAIVWGEKHDEAIFDLFCERQALPEFVSALLSPSTPPSVKVQLLQTISILVQNAQRDTSFFYLLSGGYLNTLLAGALDSEDEEVGYVYGSLDLQDEEVLSYFVTFVKGLSLRLDGGSAQLCMDDRSPPSVAQGFPLFAQAVRFTTHKEMMVRTAARTALLNILRINHEKVRSHTIEAAQGMLVPSLVRAFCVAWAAAGAAVRLADAATLHVVLEAEQDLLEFLNDLMLLDIPAIGEALAKGFLVGALLPLLEVLAPSPNSSIAAGENAGVEHEALRGCSSNTTGRRPSLPQPVAQALSEQTVGLEPAQRALVANVVEHVLSGHVPADATSSSSWTESQTPTASSPSRMTMRMVTCQDDAEGTSPSMTSSADGHCARSHAHMAAPTAAVAVRAVAACARTLGTHRNIVEPVAKVLLWPSLPRAVPPAVRASGTQGLCLEAALEGAGMLGRNSRSSESWGGGSSGSQSLAGPQTRSSSDVPLSPANSVAPLNSEMVGGAETAAEGAEDEAFIPNPFREALLALISNRDKGPAPPEAPIVAWAMLELQAVLPRWLQEGVGLLPRRAREESCAHAEAKSSEDGQTGVVGSVAAEEVIMPVQLVHSVRAGARLPRIAQRAVTSALVDLLSPPRARVARLHATAAAIEALQEAAELFRERVSQGGQNMALERPSVQTSLEDGAGAEVLTAFLEEWEWHRHRDSPIDMPATCGGVQCLLRTRVVDAAAPGPADSLGKSTGSNHAARSLLTLRRLCADLTALSEEGPQADSDLSAGLSSASAALQTAADMIRGQMTGAKLANPSSTMKSSTSDATEFLSTGDHNHGTSRGSAVALGSLKEAAEIIECVEPGSNEGGASGVHYTTSRALVLHPTLLLVTEPPIGDGGVAVVRARMPVWQAISSIDPINPHALRISRIASSGELNHDSTTEKCELILHFPELGGSARALMHIEGCRVREVKRLLGQLEVFIDATLQEAVAYSSGSDPSRRLKATDELTQLLEAAR